MVIFCITLNFFQTISELFKFFCSAVAMTRNVEAIGLRCHFLNCVLSMIQRDSISFHISKNILRQRVYCAMLDYFSYVVLFCNYLTFTNLRVFSLTVFLLFLVALLLKLQHRTQHSWRMIYGCWSYFGILFSRMWNISRKKYLPALVSTFLNYFFPSYY